MGEVTGRGPTLLDVILNSDSPADGGAQLGDPDMVSLKSLGAGFTVVVTGTADSDSGSFDPLQSGDGGLA